MAKSELRQSLSKATHTVRLFVTGKLSAAAFIEQYANFYYYEALDGHEATSAQNAEERARYWIAIDLHRRIQQEVIDRLSLDQSYSLEVLKEAGRIDETEAREQARGICADRGIESILESLGDP